MSKKTIPLSQIVDVATNETQPSPNVKTFQTLVNIINSVPNAKVAVRVQLTNKLKSYCNGLLPKKEMYYTLCLADYLVKQCPVFRPQLTNQDFVELFERSAELTKSKRLSIVRNAMVIEKALKIISAWSQLYPNDLYPFVEMYERYSARGVKFPLIDDSEYDVEREDVVSPRLQKEESVDEKMKKMIFRVKESDELIMDTLQKAANTTVKIQSANALYKRSLELNSSFSALLVTYLTATNNIKMMQKFIQVQNEFVGHIYLLNQFINNPQKADLYRAYTTGHMDSTDSDQASSLPGRIIGSGSTSGASTNETRSPRSEANTQSRPERKSNLVEVHHVDVGATRSEDTSFTKRGIVKRSITTNDIDDDNNQTEED